MDSSLILARLEKFEGRIPHMYRCTGGEVTIGIGHAIPTADDSVKLPWTIAGRAATPSEIRAGYVSVAAAPLGLVAARYAPLCQCRMSDDTINALAAADVLRFSGLIAAAVPKWLTYPDCVRAALFDMAFNLGVGGPTFSWLNAALNSFRQLDARRAAATFCAPILIVAAGRDRFRRAG